MKSVSIKNFFSTIAADIYLPPDFDEAQTYPAIISAHPIGSCKEQTSGNVYGVGLALQGFVVVAFDASFQGESSGEPRHLENPSLRVEDFKAVVDYLITLPYVDNERIGALGICGGGGYAINATMTERRIKAVASITGVNIGRLMREAFSGNDPLPVLKEMSDQRTAEVLGAEPRIDVALPSSPEEAKRLGLTEIDVSEATEYYRTSRGQKPNGVNSWLFSYQAAAMGWDAYHLAEILLTQPLMVVVGNKVGAFGAYRDGYEIFGKAASKKKEIVEIAGWSHYDLYDKPEPTGLALEKVVPFFKANL
ncbi:alpha/beta hydrolase [Acidovorax sp. SUPP3434]|uniref:alpha/beta hydrolase n=1 Tax=Acidovorax sp. SUPP3434 TaxID=2920880 RepID=UPI0023DE40D4|nr:alpha/beta hydrolase [Acidovorax sp. SUPP3434]GKT02294.1 alpha/beta hydrolase [Acidovorax sp. SUPP3434]